MERMALHKIEKIKEILKQNEKLEKMFLQCFYSTI